MNKKIDNLGRFTIPFEIRKTLGIEKGDILNIYVNDDKIILEKTKTEEENIKTKEEIEEHLHNLNELRKAGLEDENLIGSIEALTWVLDTKRNENQFLNDYDDVKEEPKEVK